MLWDLIVAVIVGFIVGLIARALMPGNQSMGFFATALLGMAGSVLASYGGGALGLYPAGSPMGWGASIIGALIALFIYNQIAKKQRRYPVFPIPPLLERNFTSWATNFVTEADRKATKPLPGQAICQLKSINKIAKK